MNPGTEWAVQPYLTYMPSEFLRFRLGYKQTHRSECCSYLGFQDNGGSAKDRASSSSRPRSFWAPTRRIRSRLLKETPMSRLLP